MSTDVKFDICPNGESSITFGVADRMLDRAVMRARVNGLTASASLIGDAKTAALTQWATTYGGPPYYHPIITDLPMLYMTPVQWGTTSCLLNIRFGRTHQTKPTRPAFDMAQSDTVTYHLNWDFYDASGNALTIPYNGDDYAYAVENRYGVELLRVRTEASAADIATAKTLYNSLNTDAVMINGIKREAYTLNYQGFRMDPYDTPNGIVCSGEYLFKYCERTFARNRLQTNAAPPSAAPWNGYEFIITALTPSGKAYADGFVTHGGEDAEGGTSGKGPVAYAAWVSAGFIEADAI